VAKKKRKTLPENFEALLAAGDEAKLHAALEACEPNARGVLGRRALAFRGCSDDLARWLVARGAEVDAPDDYDATPLQSRIGHFGSFEVLLELGADVHRVGGAFGTPLHTAAERNWKEAVVRLLAVGARVDALNQARQTPLEVALEQATNASLTEVLEVVKVLLEAGAKKRPGARAAVKRVGESFEFHREGFNKRLRPAASRALGELYALLDVEPVPKRVTQTGTSSIVPKGSTWGKRHQHLWKLLVPSRGAAKTVQGEVIRISGRIGDEIHRNGGCNWDDGYRAMGRAFLEHIQTGAPLPTGDVKTVRQILRRQPKDDETDTLAKLAVRWVELNPEPLALPKPAYRR
jgi:hypothetical protein